LFHPKNCWSRSRRAPASHEVIDLVGAEATSGAGREGEAAEGSRFIAEGRTWLGFPVEDVAIGVSGRR